MNMALPKSHQPRASNLLNIFGAFHLLEFGVSLITIICVSVTKLRPLNEFGFVLFVAVFAAVYSAIWCLILIFKIWPPGSPALQYVRLIGGFIVSQFYLAAFTVCCVVSNISGLVQYESVHASFGAAAFFTSIGWVSMAVDVYLSWWRYGGIQSPAQMFQRQDQPQPPTF